VVVQAYLLEENLFFSCKSPKAKPQVGETEKL